MKQSITSKQYFQTLTILFYALIIGQVIFMIITFFSPYFFEKLILSDKEQMYLALGVSFLCVLGFSISRAIFKNGLKRLSQKGNLIEKMYKYRNLNIAKYAISEGCSMCAIIAAFLTGNTIFLTFSILLILLIFVDKPSKEKAIKELYLSGEDAQKIQNPLEIISFM